MRNLRHVLTIAAALLAASALHTTPRALGQKKEEKLQPIEAAEVDLGRPVDFEQDVYPILDKNCVACHNLAIDEGKLSLEDVESIHEGGKRGPAVVPGKPDESRLFVFASRAKNPVMPPLPNKVEAKSLSPQELGILKQWIAEGAKAGAGGDTASVEWMPIPSHLKAVYSLALSPWSDVLAAGRANRIFLYDPRSGVELARLSDPALMQLQRDGQPMYGDPTAHRDFVHSLAFSPDGNLLASGGYRVVKLWKRSGHAQLQKTTAGGAVTALAVSKDGKWAAFGSDDKSIQLWNLAQKKAGPKLSGHQGPVTGLAFNADATRLVSGSADKTLRVWNLADGKQIASLALPAASNDVVLSADAKQVVSADQDNVIRVWATPTGEEPPADGGKQDGEEQQGGEQKDGEKQEDAKPEPPKPVRELSGHGGPVTSLVLTADGGKLVSGSQDGTLRIWNLANGNQERSVNHGSPVNAVAVRPDGERVASAGENGVAKIWNAQNGQMTGETKTTLDHERAVALAEEDKQVADDRVSLAENAFKAAEKNLNDRKEALKKANEAKPDLEKKVAETQKKADEAAKKLKEAQDALAKKPDDNNLKKNVQNAQQEAQKAKDELDKAKTALQAGERAIALAQKSVKTAEERLENATSEKEAETKTQQELNTRLENLKKEQPPEPRPLRSLAFSADGNVLVTGSDDGTLAFWDGETAGRRSQSDAHEGAVNVLTAVNGAVLAGSADKSLALWDVHSQWKLLARLGASEDDPMNVASSPFVSRVLSLDFSPDGKLLVTGGGDPSRSGELLLWDVEKRSVVREFEDAHSDTIFDVEFSRDGKYLVTGAADKFVKLFDVASGEHVRSYEGHTHHVLGVSIKADNSTIASGGADQVIKVWNLETGEQKRTIKNYSKEVTSLDFIGVGENIVSSGGDKSVRLHRTNNGQNYRTLGGSNDYVFAATSSRDGKLVVGAGLDGTIRIWNDGGQLLQSIEPPTPPAADGEQQAAK